MAPLTATLTANGTTVKLDALATPAGTLRTATLGVPYASNGVFTVNLFFDNLDHDRALSGRHPLGFAAFSLPPDGRHEPRPGSTRFSTIIVF